MKYLHLLRANQWIKNIFVLIPVFFAGQLTNAHDIIYSILGFLLFSIAASMVYIINDFKDRHRDALHPLKKFRPLANKKVSKTLAFLILGVLSVILLVLLLYLNSRTVSIIIGSYIALNLLYTYLLKHIAIVDVIIIALGFVLRLLLGGYITGLDVTMWTQFLCFSLALIFAFGKRRGELLHSGEGERTRKSLDGYNLPFLDVALVISCTISLMCYIMFTFSAEAEAKFQEYVPYTAIWVFIAMLRYLQQVFVFKNSETPIKLAYQDHFLQIVVMLWIVSFGLLIYLR